MVNTIHKSNSIFELMYMVVQVNGIGVKALVDTGAMHTCVASSVCNTPKYTLVVFDMFRVFCGHNLKFL